MKLVLIGIAAAVLGASAMAQAPDAAQRAENRAKASELVDKATPGPAQRARNRAKAAELADRATPNAAQRAENRAKAADFLDKVTPSPAQRARNRAKAAELADKVTPEAKGARPTNSASADDRGDSRRRERIDDAYANWQRQHGSR